MTIYENILKIKFAYVRNDTAKITTKNHLYYHTTPHEMVICDSEGVTGDHMSH
jgi:hypothetical protein